VDGPVKVAAGCRRSVIKLARKGFPISSIRFQYGCLFLLFFFPHFLHLVMPSLLVFKNSVGSAGVTIFGRLGEVVKERKGRGVEM
jgi:hypothetical protein